MKWAWAWMGKMGLAPPHNYRTNSRARDPTLQVSLAAAMVTNTYFRINSTNWIYISAKTFYHNTRQNYNLPNANINYAS